MRYGKNIQRFLCRGCSAFLFHWGCFLINLYHIFIIGLLWKPAEDTYAQKIFANQLITVDDLLQFKKQLLEELLTALKSQNSIVPKKWMKSHEVRRLLKISPGTLQTLKSSGIIPYTKMGGIHFYDYEEIQKVLESGKINSKY